MDVAGEVLLFVAWLVAIIFAVVLGAAFVGLALGAFT